MKKSVRKKEKFYIKNKELYLDWAREVLEIESAEITRLIPRLGDNFIKAIKLISECKGRVVVTGMGKAGIIGQKFSATLSSTGTPSLWMHSAEAGHGDLGMVTSKDIVIVLSYSGQTTEVIDLLPLVKRLDVSLIAITGNIKSTLARYSDVVLDASIEREACALGLAPTTSTTVMLALCDAIAVVIQRIKGFKEEDFAFVHPKGMLGKRLLLKVKDIMRKEDRNPVVGADLQIKEVLLKITQARAGAASIVDKNGRLIGIFTDGDLRRHFEINGVHSLAEVSVKEVMTPTPIVVKPEMLAAEAAKILQDKKIDELPVVDEDGKPIGMLDIQDLLEVGLI